MRFCVLGPGLVFVLVMDLVERVLGFAGGVELSSLLLSLSSSDLLDADADWETGRETDAVRDGEVDGCSRDGPARGTSVSLASIGSGASS